MQSSEQPVLKSVFARMRNVSPARVSQYIRDGQIFGEALVGEGNRQMIVPSIANQQLGGSLDIDQVLANGKPTASAAPPTAAAAAAATGEASQNDLLAQLINSDQRRAARAKADSLEMKAEQDRRAMAADLGRYTLTAETQVAFRKRLGDLLRSQENDLPDWAKALCAEFGLADVRAMTLALRKLQRNWRSKQAERARIDGQSVAPFMADPERPVEDDAPAESEMPAPAEDEAPPRD